MNAVFETTANKVATNHIEMRDMHDAAPQTN